MSVDDARESLSTHFSEASLAPPKSSPAEEDTCVREYSKPLGEGLGVFRALMLMLIFYFVLGGILWYAWHAWRGSRGH